MHPVLKQGAWKVPQGDALIPAYPFADTNLSASNEDKLSAAENIAVVRGAIYVTGETDITKVVDYTSTDHNICKIYVRGKHMNLKHATQLGSFVGRRTAGIETLSIELAQLASLSLLPIVNATLTSETLTTVSLRNNPLGSNAAASIFRLIAATNITALNLERTELGDRGITDLFTYLATARPVKPFKLKWLSLNACGIRHNGCTQIGNFFESSNCQISTLHLDCNPLVHAQGLVKALSANSTLECLSLRSCGLSNSFESFIKHIQHYSRLHELDLGQSDQTELLGQHYNFFSNPLATHLADAIRRCRFSCLLLGEVAMTRSGVLTIMNAAIGNHTLLKLSASPLIENDIENDAPNRVIYERSIEALHETVARNVRRTHDCDYDHYLAHYKHRLLVAGEMLLGLAHSCSASARESGVLIDDPFIFIDQQSDDCDDDWDKLGSESNWSGT